MSFVESVSPFRIGLGIAVGFLTIVLVGLGYYQPSLPVAVAITLLSLVLAAGGLQPFGDTLAYYLLQGAMFTVFGLTIMIAEEVTLIAAVLTVVGFVGVLNYGRQAVRYGIWNPVNG